MNANYVILCIDDEETILDSLSMELSGRFPGVELELVQDNAEAEELARELIAEGLEIPVVVCDYIMPGRKGDEVLAAIHAIAPKARTVMLTGQSSLEGVTKAINRANLYRYIAKPWDRDDLILTLRGALESYVQDATIQRQNADSRNSTKDWNARSWNARRSYRPPMPNWPRPTEPSTSIWASSTSMC
jgi:DNA-binding NtrC family response regulator